MTDIKDIIGHCSDCGKELTSVYYGIHKQEHLFNWRCLCFVAKAKPILVAPQQTD